MESSNFIKKIDVQPKGSYFNTDKDGYLLNPALPTKIQEKWQPVLNDVIDSYKNQFGEHLVNVYVRGSVAKGEAIDGVSDVDTYAFVDLTKDQLKDNGINQDTPRHIKERYDFVEGIEMEVLPISELPDHQIILINQSICIYGEPIDVPKIKAGKDMALQSPIFHKNFKWFRDFLDQQQTNEELRKECVWFMKQMLRSGFELTMERSKKYTRDLYLCYEGFSEYYPEKEPEMKEVLDLALNPTTDKVKIKELVESFGSWLELEIPKHIKPR